MAILNPNFEIEGDSPGLAKHWTFRSFVQKERIAGFGPEPVRAWEDFERWITLKLEFEDGDLIRAFFDYRMEGVEDFEEGWNNDVYFWELPTGQFVVADFGGNPFEDFVTGWLSSPWVDVWENLISKSAEFDGRPFENFETGWRANEDYWWLWTHISSIAAMFNDGTQSVEDFETGWPQAATL